MSLNEIKALASPKETLRRRLRELGIAEVARDTFEHFPDLERASSGLVWHLSPVLVYPKANLPSGELRLCDLCLRFAFEWLDASLNSWQPTARQAQTAFLAGLLFHAPELSHIRVRAGEDVWDPFSSEPLSLWGRTRPDLVVDEHTDETRLYWLEPPAARMALLNRILPMTSYGNLDAEVAHILMPPESIRPSRD